MGDAPISPDNVIAKALREAAAALDLLDENGPGGGDQPSLVGGIAQWLRERAETDAPFGMHAEWGIRFPGGHIDSCGTDEAEAWRRSLNLNGLRPDLPTTVVRQVVMPWRVATTHTMRGDFDG